MARRVTAGGQPGRRRCVFCGKPANSREDIVPVWLTDILSNNGREEGQFLLEREQEERKSWRGRRGSSIKVKRVCGRCNNEWMSLLEREAKPILTPMLYGDPVELNPAQTLTIAQWVLKTAIVFDSTIRRPYYSKEERTELYRARTAILASPPPSFLHVWLARYSGRFSSRSYGAKLQAVATPPAGAPLRVDGYAWTFTAAAFGAQALTTRLPPQFAHRTALNFGGVEEEWRDATVRIWPPRSRLAGWPPPRAIDDAAFERFAARWPRPLSL